MISALSHSELKTSTELDVEFSNVESRLMQISRD